MICQYSGCQKEFEPERHNQVYCSAECRRAETNIRIREDYHYRRAAKSGVARICTIPGCGTKLSRYNLGRVCAKCEAEIKKAEDEKIMRMINAPKHD